VTCLFAGAHALRSAVLTLGDAWMAAGQVLASVLLFAAMGLLFVGGYGVARNAFHHRAAVLVRPEKGARPVPMFNDVVFLVFTAISFVNQVWYAPSHLSGQITDAMENALFFAVPGHAVIAEMLSYCAVDGGRVFASAVTWLLALVFAASAISRLKQTAEAIRLDRKQHPQSLSATGLAVVLGIIAVIGVQCLFVGSPLALLPCSAFVTLPGTLLIGFAPLVFTYTVYAALAALLASGGDK
jgi:hypothetical protein